MEELNLSADAYAVSAYVAVSPASLMQCTALPSSQPVIPGYVMQGNVVWTWRAWVHLLVQVCYLGSVGSTSSLPRCESDAFLPPASVSVSVKG